MLVNFVDEVAAGRVVVIENETRIDGYLVGWSEADAYFVDNIAVDPTCQRKGLGRALMDHAVAEARRLRLPALRLYTNVTMTENIAIYAGLGFVETHRVDEHGFQRVYMRRALTDG